MVGGVTYQCTQAGTTGSTLPVWPQITGDTVTDGTAVWNLPPTGSILSQVQATLLQVLTSARESVNLGLMVFGNNNHGGLVTLPILDITSTSANGPTNYANMVNAVKNLTLLNGNAQPVNEVLWDAGVYFRGKNSDGQLKISSDTIPHPSPILASCQQSEVVVLTTGNTPDTTQTNKHLTDLNGNGLQGDATDAAIYNYITDNDDPPTRFDKVQGIQSNIIQLLTAEVPILREAATSTWNSDKTVSGAYYNVQDTTQLTKALNDLLAAATVQADTSYVAPVVPVSPENKTYSGSRIYMAYFKPMKGQSWYGNLKKFGIGDYLLDKNGHRAVWVDADGNYVDDISKDGLELGAQDGSLMSTSYSYWNDVQDGGAVDKGGAGMVSHDIVYPNRKIYTYTGSPTFNVPIDLTDPSNLFVATNTAITPAMLGVNTIDDVANLIGFIQGRDAYDDNNDKSTTDERRWLFGDVLHARPVVVTYQGYKSTDEGSCSANQSLIFVGANDGMLHAIQDCNGQELWSFIPPDMLGHLSYLPGKSHAYFADATPSVYTYKNKNDGIINPDNGDRVILMFGERRGGGVDTAPTSGSYYALDVTVPTKPKLLWRIGNDTQLADGSHPFSELAETWSEPKIVKMLIGTDKKIVAFVGAGYDNIHEDTRFGNTRYFTDAALVDPGGTGEGNIRSSSLTDAGALTNPKGRGVYAIEIATLNDGGPNFTYSGSKIWGFTFGNSPTRTTSPYMKFSIPSEMAPIDSKNRGYTDTLYVGDTGGQVWRFDVGDPDKGNWSATRLYDLSSGGGRKFFYKPSIVPQVGYQQIFIGSGDREHPLNRDTTLVDRFYALKDNGAATANLDESSLADVTTDDLQTLATGTSDLLTAINNKSGWYIRLDQYPGEKVLATPTVFSKNAYFTTFTPSADVVIDVCTAGNFGTARLYAINYLTGEAVLNYNTTNDTIKTTNTRATSVIPGATPTTVILQRSDRVVTLGSGIASQLVLRISASGTVSGLVAANNELKTPTTGNGGSIKPLYWRKK